MARKFGPAVVKQPTNLRQRVELAIAEKRFQTGLDLARQLFRQEPGPAQRDLLFQATFGRARQLREQGATNDAAAMLERAREVANGEHAKLSVLIEELANCGDYARAQAIFDALPEPKPAIKLLERAADIALERGAKGRDLLPEIWRGDYDCIRSAFAHLAAGQDDDVRTRLQAIGLQSPFLEWKLLLRGLLAYYQNDDARALENWQRLDLKLAPARLAALFRWQIDPDFRAVQAPEAQRAIQQQVNRLNSDTVLGSLRRIQAEFAQGEGMGRSSQLDQHVVEAFRQQFPALLPKLANCFYWQSIRDGRFRSMVSTYRKYFAAPADDPQLQRLEALMHETAGEFAQANGFWKAYADSLPGLGAAFPGTDMRRAQAQVWLRMAKNADQHKELVDRIESVPIFAFAPAVLKPKPLPQDAEECLRKATALAPCWRTAQWELFEFYQAKRKPTEAIAVGRRILEFAPNDLPTITALVELLQSAGHHVEATDLIERALVLNPLLTEFQPLLLNSKHLAALELAGQNKVAAAQAMLASALKTWPNNILLLVCSAALDFLVGENTRADETLQRVFAADRNRAMAAAHLYALAVVLKLPKALKTRFDKEFKTYLNGPANLDTTVALAVTFAMYARDGFAYYGMQAHIKKTIAQVRKTIGQPYALEQLQRLGTALIGLKQLQLLRRLVTSWKKQYPAAPEPLHFEVESALGGYERNWNIWRLRPLLENAKRLLATAPADEYRVTLCKLIDARLEQFDELQGPQGRGFNGDFDSPFFDGFLDEDEFEKEEEFW